ncbi:MAG: NADH-quinone oxidoreductase subunit NuoE [Spirochaetales bacterium]|nr:NADH-quinone oxidoreductase subunit NuoE [Spirochaetales bacterium]
MGLKNESVLREEKGIHRFKIDLLRKTNESSSLIPLLQSAQESYGYIPEDAIYYISELVGIPAADIYGVITFYTQFRLRPLGKYLIKVCEGTACHVNGAKKIVKAIHSELGINIGETDPDGFFSLQSVACLGCCSLSPAMMIGDRTYGSLTVETVRKILKNYREGAIEE